MKTGYIFKPSQLRKGADLGLVFKNALCCRYKKYTDSRILQYFIYLLIRP